MRRAALRCLCAASLGAALPATGMQTDSRPAPTLGSELREKYALYLLLTFALVASRWRIRRSSPEDRKAYAAAYPGREFSEYIGHNIGALLLGPADELLAFEMNEASAALSSLEHAELKAVRVGNRRLNLKRFREGDQPASYASLFDGCTLYTTLESCTQCAGVMHLAGVDTVVHGQTDQVQQAISDKVYQMHRDGPLPAPRPIKGDFLPLVPQLESAYAAYQSAASAGGHSIGTTAFLSSPAALRVFAQAQEQLRAFAVQHPQNRWHQQRALKLFAAFTDPELRHALVS